MCILGVIVSSIFKYFGSNSILYICAAGKGSVQDKVGLVEYFSSSLCFLVVIVAKNSEKVMYLVQVLYPFRCTGGGDGPIRKPSHPVTCSRVHPTSVELKFI